MKRLFFGLLLCSAVVFTSCKKDDRSVPIPVTDVKLDKTTLSLTVGASSQLTPTVAPDNATDRTVIWSTSDASVATVVDGKVTGVKVGNARITVTTKDGNKTAICAVTVNGPVREPTVYVGGYSTPVDIRVGTVWTNGQSMSIERCREALSLFVAGDDLYTSGFMASSDGKTPIAAYWKNNTPVQLSDGKYWSRASSIFVVGNDVYTGGTDGNAADHLVATYWKNSEEQALTDGNDDAEVESIYVVGNDVYTAGYEKTSNSHIPISKIWKNDKELVALSDGTIPEQVQAIIVVGNTIYAVGDKGAGSQYTAKYWKVSGNGDIIENKSLSDDTGLARAFSVAVTPSGDVYVAGYNNSGAILWKNGTSHVLAAQAYAFSVFLTSGGEVYVAGAKQISDQDYCATYWKDGTETILKSSHLSVGYSIYVKE